MNFGEIVEKWRSIFVEVVEVVEVVDWDWHHSTRSHRLSILVKEFPGYSVSLGVCRSLLTPCHRHYQYLETHRRQRSDITYI